MSHLKVGNWAKFVFDSIIAGVQHYKLRQQNSVNSCIIVLMCVTLIGEAVAPLVPQPTSRIRSWGDEEIRNRLQRLQKLGGYKNDKIKVVFVEVCSDPPEVNEAPDSPD